MTELVGQAAKIWLDGGWAMWPLALNSLIVFAIGAAVLLRLREKGHRVVPESVWRGWVEEPSRGRGPIGQLIQFAMAGSTLEDVGVKFSEMRATELNPFDRDIKFMKRAVSTAPLLGLLGTVTGMLTTFDALSSGSGGQKTMDMVAGGISEALITTEMGLVIALPGLFLQYHLSRGKDRYAAFLAHLETVCTQRLYRARKEAA